MKYLSSETKRGFTFVEVLVAVAILAILSAIAMSTYQEVRKKSRDIQRKGDMETLQVAFRMYRDVNATNILPGPATGDLIGDGIGVEADIGAYVSGTIVDPLDRDSNRYYYDSVHNCGGVNHAVLIVGAMERSGQANYETVCDATPEDLGSSFFTPTIENSYIVLLN